jgi:CRISPR-associated endonuclease/helicase Cas3
LVRWATKGIDDTAGERGVAQVRDSDESIEVVIIQRIDGRLVVPKWSAEYPSESVENGTVIDDDLARVVARNVVRLPGYLGLGQQGGNLIAELEDNYMPTWQNSTWLRGVLPMILDNHGATTCAGHVFRYDIDRGLLVERQGKN